ncbi:MAG TPA: ScbR family autoregulator-binding transcription factor [Pseudonocardiaceae bacterium]
MPQQHRAHATRDAILSAAAEEFDRSGYAATPLSAILRRSGVTKGAFYFHFPSKEALAATLVEMQAATWPELQKRWDQRSLDPLRRMIGLITDTARVLAGDTVVRAGVRLATEGEVSGLGSDVLYPRWEPVLAGLLEQAQQEGLLREGVRPERAARMLHAVVTGARAISWTTDRCTRLVERTDEMWPLVLPGIARDSWLQDWLAERARWPATDPE